MKESRKMPSVLLVIVNYNGQHLLKKHLPSVVKTICPDLKIVVVDNGSEDGSVEFLRENYPKIEVIENGRNLGFGRANNMAFRKFPDYDYYALLNNDMDVEPDWLEKLVEVAEKDGLVKTAEIVKTAGSTDSDAKIGAVGPKILYSEKKDGKYVINSAGMVIDKYYRGFDRYEGKVDDQKYSIIEEVDSLCGGAILLRGLAVHQAGGFDEKMFFYYEDVDLCLRLKGSGWKIVYNGEAVVYHDHMGTAGTWSGGRRTFTCNRNRILSIWTRIGVVTAIVELVRSPLEWICCKLTGRDYNKVVLTGAGLINISE